MKDILKQERGVSLVSLAITVIIILAITGMLIYNSKDSIHIKSLTYMYNDIANLRDKVSEYYAEYGDIPVKQVYTNTNSLSGVIGANDTGDFFVIDLNSIDGLTLTYGQDYEQIKETNDQGFIDEHKDLYIINSNSHNIFYVKGIKYEINGETKTYYTDEHNPDIEKVQLKYVDGIRIPEGAEYIRGNRETELIIKKDGAEYKWIALNEKIDKTYTDGLNIEENKKDEFIKSANGYKGYFLEINKDKPKVIYYDVDETNGWIEYYSQEGKYRDSNGEEAYIPAGFYVSSKPTINQICNGLVIKDENDNEYVWISVPKEVTKDATNDSEIEEALIKYTEEFRQEGYTDEWYEGCGLKEADYNAKKSTMLNSIKDNGGFYIARYEMGLEKSTPKNGLNSGEIEDLIQTDGLPISKKDKYPYNFVTCGQAQQLSERIAPNGRTSSLMFQIQWDLVLKFLNIRGEYTIKDLVTDSTEIGNYSQTNLPIIGTNVKGYNTETLKWNSLSGSKPENTSMLLTTGASEKTKMMNIYDFAGNLWEWTLGKASKDLTKPSTQRGGIYSKTGSEHTISSANYTDIITGTHQDGFRTTIY